MTTAGIGTRVALVWLLCAAAVGARSEEAYRVVVHPDSALTSISRTELSEIFLKRVTQWSGGAKALPVDQSEGRPVRERFSRDILGRRAAAVKSHWHQVVFSGRGVPPPEKGTDHDVIAYVKARPGAVGYVSAATPIEGVKVLRVEP